MAEPDARDVIDSLGPVLVGTTTGDLSTSVTSVLLTDPSAPADVTAGAAILAVGYSIPTPEFTALCERAHAERAAIILVKSDVGLAESPVAVAAIDPAADWLQIANLVRIASTPEQSEEGETLFGVAEAIAALCGSAVVIHDDNWELLAYSRGQPEDPVRHDTILRREAPGAIVTALREADLLQRIQRGEPVFIDEGHVAGLSPRFTVGVCVNGEFLGSIWALVSPTASRPEVLEILRRAAGSVALPLLARRARTRNLRSEGDVALASLLNGGRTERLLADRLNIAADGGHLLAGFRPHGSPADHDGEPEVSELVRLERTARTYLSTYRIPHALTGLPGTVYLLLPCAGKADRARLVKMLTELQGRIQPMTPHRTVVSRTNTVLSDAALLRADVDQLHSLAGRRGWSAALIDGSDLEAELRLDQFRELTLAHPALLHGPIQRIIDHEREHPGELAESLATWFECQSDSRTTASRLNIHVNTVRYRIRRAAEIGGIDLAVSADRLLAELQARILLR